MRYKIDKPVFLIELFGGVGTQAMAFQTLGVPFFRGRMVEWDKDACNSYNAIHGTNFEPTDIRNFHGSDLGVEDKEHNHYFLTYSFPCTDISTAGKMRGFRKEDWEEGNATSSGLLWEVMRILKEAHEMGEKEGDSSRYLPDTLLMENVTGVHNKKNLPYFNEWLLFLESVGYKTVWSDMNACDYGVPQSRARCFAVSFLDTEAEFYFPNPIPLSRSMEDLLEEEADEKYFVPVEDAGAFLSCSRKENA